METDRFCKGNNLNLQMGHCPQLCQITNGQIRTGYNGLLQKTIPFEPKKTTMVQWRLRVFEEDVTTKPDVATGKEAADRKPRTDC